MIRTVAAWYSVICGAALAAAPFIIPSIADSTEPSARVRTIVFVVAGVLLAVGGFARLMRLPGRVASVYLGIGAGLTAVPAMVAWMLAGSAPVWQVAVVGAAGVLLVGVSWALWPSGA
jgi:hypothetical protein